MDNNRIVIIGSGNVASALAVALDDDDRCRVVQIASRNIDHARTLAEKLKSAQPTDSIADIVTDADYYIIAVNDDAIADIAARLPQVSGVVAHTSGSVPIEALTASVSGPCGVFYPLQTFSKGFPVDMSRVPFFIEGSDADAERSLKELAACISSTVNTADSSQRAKLHLAAVVACNFTNHLWVLANGILSEAGYSMSVLEPLIFITGKKAFAIGPEKAQTGPAARGDKKVIEQHLIALPENLRNIYALLTQSIIDSKDKN